MGLQAAEAEQSLEERYGKPSRIRRLIAIAAIGVLAAGFLAFLVWAALANQSPGYGAAMHSYDVVGKHRVRTLISVHRAAGTPMVCTVTAQAVDHALVGEDQVHIPAGPERDFTVVVRLKTDRRATTATVTGCR
jgi:Domain of unknown function (DUF4307)